LLSHHNKSFTRLISYLGLLLHFLLFCYFIQLF